MQGALPGLEDTMSDAPAGWTGAGHAHATYLGIVVLGLALTAFVALAADGGDVAGGSTFDTVIGLGLGPLIVLVALAGLVQARTWRMEVGPSGQLHVGGALRSRSVDLTKLQYVALRPERHKGNLLESVRLVVADQEGREAELVLGWHELSWPALHAITWHARNQGLPLSGPTKLALAISDARTHRRVLDHQAPRPQGPVRCRRGRRPVRAGVWRSVWFVVLFAYGAVVSHGARGGHWITWSLAILAALAAVVAIAFARGHNRTVSVDATARLATPHGAIDLTRLAMITTSPPGSDRDGPYFETLQHLGLNGMRTPPDGQAVGIGVLYLEDADGNRADIEFGDAFEPMAPLMARIMHEVDRQDLEVSAYVRYNLRFAAGEVPLSEHEATVDRVTSGSAPI